MPCAAPCNRLPCNKRCTEQMSCGHQCPGLCGENCPEEYCQECGMKNDESVDMIEFKTYGEINLNDTPVVFLNCGHFFTAENLDGIVSIQEVYEIDRKTGEISGLKDMSTQLAKTIPFCPQCRTRIRQYATQRYNRLINRAVIDEMSKRFIVTGQAELQALEERLQKLEKELGGSSAAVIPRRLARMSAHYEESLAAELTKQLKARYQAHAKLQGDILRFQQRMDNCHQPAHKLHEATIYAMQQDRNTTLDSVFAAFSLRDTIPSSERDHRIPTGARNILLKADCIGLEDNFEVLHNIESWNKRVAASVQFPVRQPRQLIRPFLQKCAKFVAYSEEKKLPKLAVEGTLYFARVARLYATLGLTEDKDREKAASYRDKAKALLENAQELCKKNFQDAEALLQAVSESLKLLQRPWYEEVTAEELAAIKAAMVSGRTGIATHSGHWYNCENGHPVRYFRLALHVELANSDTQFAIGECGMPMEEATCPECGARVGGQNHQAVAGVTRAENMED
jgi:hypothetical protein